VNGSLVAAGDAPLANRVESFVRKVYSSDTASITKIRQLEEKAQQLHLEVQEMISQLVMRIEVGEPLVGRCEICPNFAIVD